MKKIVLLLLISLSACGKEMKEAENRGSEHQAQLIRDGIELEKKTAAKCEAMGGLVIYGERRHERVTKWEPDKSYDISWIPFKACQFPQGNVVITPKEIEK